MKQKKPYSKPKLKRIGSVRELTNKMSTGGVIDTGIAPNDKKPCITPAPQIEEHKHLLQDYNTQTQFQKIIAATVKPGDVVLDLGTGSGLHAFFACQAGAKKVYAVDIEAIVEVARDTARANGFGDRIEFIMGEARDLQLPEKVDVIITNIGFLNTLQTMPEIARTHLKPGGNLIPSALELEFTLITAPDFYAEQVSFWDSKKFDIDFTSFRQMASQHPLYTIFQPDHFLAAPQSMGRVELLGLDQDYMESTMTLVASQDGLAHGLAGWYNFWAGKELVMSTKPPLKLDKKIWTNIFLPFDRPLNLTKGETYTFEIGMYARGGYRGPFWRWKGERSGETVVDQCSFYATPLSQKILEKISLH